MSAITFYKLLEEGIVEILAPVVMEETVDEKLFETCDRYAGEFGGTFSAPEEWTPERRYALVQVLGNRYNRQLKSSINQNTLDGRVTIHVGSQRESFLRAKDDVYEMIDVVEDLLHGKKIMHEGNVLCQLLIDSNLENFAIPNHVCWTVTMQIVANKNY